MQFNINTILEVHCTIYSTIHINNSVTNSTQVVQNFRPYAVFFYELEPISLET
jgi:hypothetical protein